MFWDQNNYKELNLQLIRVQNLFGKITESNTMHIHAIMIISIFHSKIYYSGAKAYLQEIYTLWVMFNCTTEAHNMKCKAQKGSQVLWDLCNTVNLQLDIYSAAQTFLADYCFHAWLLILLYHNSRELVFNYLIFMGCGTEIKFWCEGASGSISWPCMLQS